MNPREWFEDEDFWTAYAPLMFDEAHWAEVPAIVDAIERLAKPAEARPTLATFVPEIASYDQLLEVSS